MGVLGDWDGYKGLMEENGTYGVLGSRVFCDGWVTIASFLCRQKRHLFDVLLYVDPSFSISQVIVGEIFMSFRCLPSPGKY